MVTKATFQTLAANLEADAFADFFDARTFSNPDFTHPVTGVVTAGTSESVGAVRIDYTAEQFQNQQIQARDFQLLARVQAFSAVDPKVTGTTVLVDSIECQIVTAQKDAAEAVWTFQVRPL